MEPVRILLAALIGFAVTVQVADAAVINVPSDDYPTIQSGLNAAQTGDTVMVAAGTYPESLFWPFRNGIVLLGAGMDETIVVDDGSGTVVYMVHTAIDSTTILRGLGFRNGGDAGITLSAASPLVDSCSVELVTAGPGIHILNGSTAKIRNCRIANNSGSGIRCEDSSPILAGNTITGNTADYGGGVYSQSGSPTLTGNTITGNTAYSGGGVFSQYGSATLTGNTITGNNASSGGGVYSTGGSPSLTGNTITGNNASSGGGVYSTGGSPTLTGNTITANTASHGGGGVLIEFLSSPTLTGNMITGNNASSGGGIHILDSFPILTGNSIARNTASNIGGGVYIVAGSPTLTNNTITQNHAMGDGGGIAVDEDSTPQISLCTITENTADGTGDGIHNSGSATAVSACNIAWNGWGFRNATAQPIPSIQGNWWGHESGPWHSELNPAGLGDSLSTYAWDFLPYLTEAETEAPPMPPRNLRILRTEAGSLSLIWDAVPLGDLAGYRLYFATESGFPYADTVDVGNTTEHLLDGLEAGVTYYLAVTCYDTDGEESWYSRQIEAVVETSSIADGAHVHTNTRLLPSQPNPFGESTTIRFALPDPQEVRVMVVNIHGQRVGTLAEGSLSAGTHERTWRALDESGRPLPAGIYMVVLESGGVRETSKIVRMR